MKITDLPIESIVQITKLSAQEASEVVGGSDLTDVMESAVKAIKPVNVSNLIEAIESLANTQNSTGVPTEGEEHDPSGYLP